MNKYLKVLIKPKEVFEQEKEKASIRKSVLIVFVASFLSGLIYLIASYSNPLFSFLNQILEAILPPGSLITQYAFVIFPLIAFPIANVISFIIFTFIVFLISRLLGGRKGYYRMFLYLASISYASTQISGVILNQIPVIGVYLSLLVTIYYLYLLFLIIEEAFSLSRKKTIIVILVCAVIFLLPQLDNLNQAFKMRKDFSYSDHFPGLDCSGLRRDLETCLAVKFGEPSLCEENSRCYQALALLNDDPSLCEKAGSSKVQCYRDMAKERLDSSMCDKIDDDWCYLEVSIATNDSESCEPIKDNDRRNYCLTKTLKTNFCDDIEGSLYKSDCYFFLAKKTNNPSLCDMLKWEQDQVACLAIVQNNYSLCETITSEWERNDCYHSINMVLKNVLGEGLKDATVCSSITKDSERSYCFFHVAKNTKDKELCDKTTRKEYCLGLITLDESFCEKISICSEEDSIYSICGWITVADEKEDCYFTIGVEKDNKVCNKLDSGLERVRCYLGFEHKYYK